MRTTIMLTLTALVILCVGALWKRTSSKVVATSQQTSKTTPPVRSDENTAKVTAKQTAVNRAVRKQPAARPRPLIPTKMEREFVAEEPSPEEPSPEENEISPREQIQPSRLIDIAQRLALDSSDKEKIRDEIEELLEIDEENSTVWTLKAQLHLVQGDLESAEEAIDDCLGYDRSALLCMEARVTTSIFQASLEGFQAAQDECLTAHPDSEHCMNPLGNFLPDHDVEDFLVEE